MLDVPSLSIGCVTHLVNEWGTTPRRVSTRPWSGYPDATSPVRQFFLAEWGESPSPADETIRVAVDEVYPVFSTGDTVERAHLVNRLGRGVQLTPRVHPWQSHLVLAWAVPPRRSGQLLAALVAALMLALTDPHRHRLGVCAADDCADVFADQSPRHNRAYCSTRCQTRQRVRLHRARRSGTSVS